MGSRRALYRHFRGIHGYEGFIAVVGLFLGISILRGGRRVSIWGVCVGSPYSHVVKATNLYEATSFVVEAARTGNVTILVDPQKPAWSV